MAHRFLFMAIVVLPRFTDAQIPGNPLEACMLGVSVSHVHAEAVFTSNPSVYLQQTLKALAPVKNRLVDLQQNFPVYTQQLTPYWYDQGAHSSHNADIQSLITGIADYETILTVLTDPATYNSNISSYLAEAGNRQRVIDLQGKMKGIKKSLMNSGESRFAPMVAFAMQIQYFLNAYLLEIEAPVDFQTELKKDRKYFEDQIGRLMTSLDKLKSIRKRVLDNPGINWLVEINHGAGNFYVFDCVLYTEIDTQLVGNVFEKGFIENEDGFLLRKIGLLDEMDLPRKWIVGQYTHLRGRAIATQPTDGPGQDIFGLTHELKAKAFLSPDDIPVEAQLTQFRDGVVDVQVASINNTQRQIYFAILNYSSAYYAAFKANGLCVAYLKL